MTNKSTKRAIISTVMVIVLCITTLVGLTLAWFNDSVINGINKIRSGNLDVELWHHTGAKASKVMPDGSYFGYSDDVGEEVESDTVLFLNEDGEEILWEPGATAVENFRIKNVGSLALKYQFKLEVANATQTPSGKTLADVVSLSMEHITYADNGAPQRHTIVAGELLGDGYVIKGELLPDKSYDFYVGLEWVPSDLDYEYNVKGGLDLDLGITLIATQLTYEKDDISGDQYDKDAVYTDFVVSSEEELKVVLGKVNNGAVIGIEGNVTWTTGAAIGSTPFVENAVTYSTKPAINNLTFVGIGSNPTFTATGKGVGAIGIDNGTVKFENLKIVDESESYAENSWEFGYLEFRGKTVFEDCDFVNAIMMDGDSATFKNCSFNSNKDNEYAVWVSNGDAKFENCYITGARGIKIHEAYGSEVDTVVIKDNQFMDLSKKPGLAIGDVNANTTIALTNNTFAGTQPGDQGKYTYETDTDVITFNFQEKDNTVTDYADTNEEIENSLENGATITIPKGEYTLPTLSGVEGITIIGDANGGTVVGGSNEKTGFGGNFGKDTTIQNVTFSGGTNGVRYSYANGGSTTFDNCTFKGESTYGFHIDQSKGATFTFNNCTFSGFNAFASDLEKVVFNNCTFLHNGNYGHTNIWSVGEFNNCTFGDGASVSTRGDNATLIFNGEEESYYHEYIGSAESLINFAESTREGDAWKGQKVILVDDIDLAGVEWTPTGAFAGTFDGNGHTISNLTINGESNVGFFGRLNSTAVIKNLTFDKANLSGTHYVGVIIGWEGNETVSATIDKCTVINSVITCDTDASNDNGDKVGGICGYAVTLNITNCTVKDTTIKAYRDFGGIIGCANGSKTVVIKNNTVENVTLVIDNEVNYKNYTTDAEHNANAVCGRNNGATIEGNVVK